MNLEIALSELKFNSDGLIPAIVQDDATGKVLMLAWQNQESLELTVKTREAVFFSRSRNEIWHKGKTSGNVQKVTSISFDCDLDTILMKVIPMGPACHTGSTSCFDDRTIDLNE